LSGCTAARRGWEPIVELALTEDIGTGDVTTGATIAPSKRARGSMLVKSSGIVSGLDVAAYTFWHVDPTVRFTQLVNDGNAVKPGNLIVTLEGPARSLLLAERVALNFLQRLSGVATLTARYAAAVSGTGSKIVDTRKTTPGMRILEKAAVRDGGGHNHRVGLSDGVLIKDNHLAAIGGPDRITKAVQRARDVAPHTIKIEVEVTSLAEVREAVAAGAEIVMMDNMNLTTMREAVQIVAGRAIVEASGGITLDTVRAVAETGVDLISVGALTHSAPALDISLNFELE
jgi:nicotinate-nucleotide pyrophosphorylase (carboxylating)